MYACATIVKKKHRAADRRILGRVGTQPHSKSSRDNDLANVLSGLPSACRFCARSFGIATEWRKTDREAVMAILEGRANKDSDAGKMPSEELLSAMGKYNEELLKAGLLLDLAGLQPSSKGARIKFSGEKPAGLTAVSQNQRN